MSDPRKQESCFSSESLDGVTDISHLVLMVEPRGDVLEPGNDPDGILIGALALAKQGPDDYYFERQVWCRFSLAKARSIGERLIRLADDRANDETNRPKGPQ